MKYSEIKSLSPEERQEQLDQAIASLHSLKFAHAVSPIEDPMRIRQTRRNIARLKTAQNAAVVQQQLENTHA